MLQVKIKNPNAFMLLVLVLFSLTGGGWLLARAVRHHPVDPPPFLAMILILVAVVVLIIAQSETNDPQFQDNEKPTSNSHRASQVTSEEDKIPQSLHTRKPSTWKIYTALAITVIVWVMLASLDKKSSHLTVSLAWILANLLYLNAFVPLDLNSWRYWRSRAAQHWVPQRGRLLLLLGIVSATLFLRIWLLEDIPHTLAGDESAQGLETLRVIQGEIRSPFRTGWTGVPTMSFYLNSLSLRWMGATKTALRLPWAILGTAAVLSTYFLVKEILGYRAALASAAIVGSYHYHIHFSRLGSNQISDTLFVSLALFFLSRALHRRHIFDWVLTGLVCGFALYFYTGGRLASIIVLFVLVHQISMDPKKRIKIHQYGILAGLGMFFITSAPMLQFAIRYADEFNSRVNQVGIIQSGWLVKEQSVRAQGVLPILFDQFQRAALAFNFYPDKTVWYGLRQPLLDPWFGALFLLGLGYTSLRLFRRNVDEQSVPMVFWWWGGMILGGMLTVNPPSSMRIITLSIPTCFFIVVAVRKLNQLASRTFQKLPDNAVLWVSVAIFAGLSLKTYFIDFTPQFIYGGKNAELATNLAPLLNNLTPDYEAVFFGPPQMFWEFPTIPYLSADMPGKDVDARLQAPPPVDFISPGRGAIFIFLPDRASEMTFVKTTFPNGKSQNLYSYGPEKQLLATVYLVAPP